LTDYIFTRAQFPNQKTKQTTQLLNCAARKLLLEPPTGGVAYRKKGRKNKNRQTNVFKLFDLCAELIKDNVYEETAIQFK
jgi:hypothetical protein